MTTIKIRLVINVLGFRVLGTGQAKNRFENVYEIHLMFNEDLKWQCYPFLCVDSHD